MNVLLFLGLMNGLMSLGFMCMVLLFGCVLLLSIGIVMMLLMCIVVVLGFVIGWSSFLGVGIGIMMILLLVDFELFEMWYLMCICFLRVFWLVIWRVLWLRIEIEILFWGLMVMDWMMRMLLFGLVLLLSMLSSMFLFVGSRVMLWMVIGGRLVFDFGIMLMCIRFLLFLGFVVIWYCM